MFWKSFHWSGGANRGSDRGHGGGRDRREYLDDDDRGGKLDSDDRCDDDGRDHHRRGHDKDDDDVFDHGHDAHGNGNGFGHDKHGDDPPAGDECIEVDENQTFVFDLDNADELHAGTGDEGVLYAIVGGADAALFDVDASTGVLTFISTPDFSAPDFEAPRDQGGDNGYEVVVRAMKVANPCKYLDTELKACVQDVVEAPPPAQNVAPQIAAPEDILINRTTVGTVFVDVDAIDPDNGPEPISFALTGEDADFFEFDTATGEIILPDGVELFETTQNSNGKTIFVPIVESADGNFTFELTVTASDGLGTDVIDLQIPLILSA